MKKESPSGVKERPRRLRLPSWLVGLVVIAMLASACEPAEGVDGAGSYCGESRRVPQVEQTNRWEDIRPGHPEDAGKYPDVIYTCAEKREDGWEMVSYSPWFVDGALYLEQLQVGANGEPIVESVGFGSYDAYGWTRLDYLPDELFTEVPGEVFVSFRVGGNRACLTPVATEEVRNEQGELVGRSQFWHCPDAALNGPAG